MRSSHTVGRTQARFDDPNLVSHAGLVPLVRLMENIDLAGLADDLVRLGGSRGANAGAKITTIVAGMAAGADSIEDLGQLRHGAMSRLFTGIRAPSTLGEFLRWFTVGHNAQLEKTAAAALARLAARVALLPGVDRMALIDLDSKLTQVFGRTKQGARFGHKKIRGLDSLAATLSSPGHAPVITNTRLRGGNADTRRKVTSFARQAVRVARACGATGTILVRGDSGFYAAKLIAGLAAEGVLFSITARQSKGLQRAIATLDEHAWTPVTYDTPVIDEHTGDAIHTAQIAETTYTAFTNPTQNPGRKTTARLIVRRTRITAVNDQGELFPTWRYHAIFTNTDADLITAEAQHRARAGSIEHVFADLNNSALAHFPSAHFAANAAWLTPAALAHNLTRAAGVLAGGKHARARTTTLRHRLIGIAARISRTARTLTLHLPATWPWHHAWQQLFTASHPRPSPR
jgi:hypothetical protein